MSKKVGYNGNLESFIDIAKAEEMFGGHPGKRFELRDFVLGDIGKYSMRCNESGEVSGYGLDCVCVGSYRKDRLS